MPAPAAPKEPDPSETRVAAVKQVLDTKLAQYGGTWSAPYIDLERGRDVTVNDEKTRGGVTGQALHHAGRVRRHRA